jgi:hypothetical protein
VGALAPACGGPSQAVRADQERYAADTRACDGAGDAAACFRLAERDLHGRPPASDAGQPWTSARAMSRFGRACDLGHADACLRLDPAQLTPERARWISPPYATRACNRGVLAGCLVMLRNPRRVPQAEDFSALAKRACYLDATFCPEVADRLLPIDLRGAISMAARPCDMGVAEPCDKAANLPLPEAALDYLQRRACELGSAATCGRLAERWRKTRPWDSQMLFRLACKRGDADACSGLRRLQAEP